MPKPVDTITTGNSLDMDKVRSEFPMLSKVIRGKKLIYLDNAATTQKPWRVIHRAIQFETDEYATVRRGSYRLGEEATESYENVRSEIAKFIGAGSPEEIVFTSGATQAINLVAHSYGRKVVGEGDEIIISHMEHHANIIPWKLLCDEKGATLKVIPVNDKGELLLDEYKKLLSYKTKIVAVTHVSNALGTVNPVEKIVALAKEVGAVTLVDGAQSCAHMRVNMFNLGCDFFVFSGHKMYAPSGVGVLFGKSELLDVMPPYVTGGEMIKTVTFDKITFADPPHRFEAGTPPVSQVIGLGAAIGYLNDTGLSRIERHEKQLLNYAISTLKKIQGLRIIGDAENRAGVVSFTLDAVHPHDVVTILSEEGIAVRGGHHCAQPIMRRFGVPATVRASVGVYNTFEDIDALADGLKKAIRVFA